MLWGMWRISNSHWEGHFANLIFESGVETDDLIANRNIIRDLQLDMIFIKSIRLIFFSLSVAIDAFADCSW